MHTSAHSSERKPLIAVVDDHHPCRRGICRLLERNGYATCSFGSVAEFIHSPDKAKISCLISDVRMPEIDGVSLHECLKRTNYDFPIVFCTGLRDDERLERALADGAFALLHKPVRSEKLREVVAAACATAAARHRK